MQGRLNWAICQDFSVTEINYMLDVVRLPNMKKKKKEKRNAKTKKKKKERRKSPIFYYN